jgi:oligopeptidase B
MNPPIAKKIKRELKAFDDIRIDDYYWLNQRENKEVIDYLKAENDYTEAMLEDFSSVKELLFKEITGRIKQTD